MRRVVDLAMIRFAFRATNWLFVLLVSCTIIEDGDITSQEELQAYLDKLKLKSIEIGQ